MRKTIVCLILLVSFYSCQKDELSGDKEIMIGKWNWIFTIQYHYGDFIAWQDTIFPATIGERYSIEFLEKGVMLWNKNDDRIDRQRIIFTFWKEGVNGTANINNFNEFSIKMSNDLDFFGYLNPDTLITNDLFPFSREDDSYSGSIYVANYFIHE